MRRIPGLLMAWLVVFAVMVGSAAGAAASPTGPRRQTHGWGSAKACLLPASGKFECFATESALKARSAQLRRDTPMSGCPVDLYRGAGYTGNLFEVWSQGYWVNLANYGFDKATVSFIGTGCGFHLADHAWGGGSWYPGYTGPWAATWDMGWWDWRTSSVWVG